MDNFNSIAIERLSVYKQKVLDRFLEEVMSLCAFFTDNKCEQQYITFRVFVTLYQRLDDFADDAKISAMIDDIRDKILWELMQEPNEKFDFSVTYMVMLYLWSTRNILNCTSLI